MWLPVSNCPWQIKVNTIVKEGNDVSEDEPSSNQKQILEKDAFILEFLMTEKF